MPPAQRYKLTLAYRGTHYHGWQWQPVYPTYTGPTPEEGHGIPTIESHVARALGKVVGHPVTVVGSSRTDARVHAKGQLAHFDTHRTQIPPENIRRAANHILPDDIIIRSVEPVPDTFHAIASTISKRYQYLIWNDPDRPVFTPDLAWHRWQTLDIPAMQHAASLLVGTHDFASFARAGHGRTTTTRTILACTVHKRGPRLVIATEGTGFLWNMVRIIVSTLVEVGLHQKAADSIPKILAAKDRRAAGGTAPAHGLYLHWVKTKPVDARSTPGEGIGSGNDQTVAPGPSDDA